MLTVRPLTSSSEKVWLHVTGGGNTTHVQQLLGGSTNIHCRPGGETGWDANTKHIETAAGEAKERKE